MEVVLDSTVDKTMTAERLSLRTLHTDPSFTRLANKIKELAGDEPIEYYASPGNWGDSLINGGTSDFLGTHGVHAIIRPREYVMVADRRATLRRLALVGGGGGWNRNWSSSIDFTEQVSRAYRAVVVLPSSFDPRIVSRPAKGNVVLYSRAVGESLEAADEFCHDMAFHLQGYGRNVGKVGHPLIALRRDKERHALSVDPDRNWDLSLLGNAFTEFQGLVDIVARFQRIYTDRLHIAIIGSMLGAEVRLFDGNYGKNVGVYDASLDGRYPKVRMESWESFDWTRVFGAKRIGAPGY